MNESKTNGEFMTEKNSWIYANKFLLFCIFKETLFNHSIFIKFIKMEPTEQSSTNVTLKERSFYSVPLDFGFCLQTPSLHFLSSPKKQCWEQQSESSVHWLYQGWWQSGDILQTPSFQLLSSPKKQYFEQQSALAVHWLYQSCWQHSINDNNREEEIKISIIC